MDAGNIACATRRRNSEPSDRLQRGPIGRSDEPSVRDMHRTPWNRLNPRAVLRRKALTPTLTAALTPIHMMNLGWWSSDLSLARC